MAHSDKGRRDIKRAYGRYSGSDQADESRRKEVRDHGVYGARPESTPGHEPESTAGRPAVGRRLPKQRRSPSRAGNQR